MTAAGRHQPPEPQCVPPTTLDNQTVVRMNRDTRYSCAVVDLAKFVAIPVPERVRDMLRDLVVSA